MYLLFDHTHTHTHTYIYIYVCVSGMDEIVEKTKLSSFGPEPGNGEGKSLDSKLEESSSGESVAHWYTILMLLAYSKNNHHHPIKKKKTAYTRH